MKKQTTTIKSEIVINENGAISANHFTDDGKPIKATVTQKDNVIISIFDEPITVTDQS